MKADLEVCPPWILSKLKTERDLRRKLAEQTKEQTRILLEEVKDWRAKAYNYQREAQEKEAQRKKKQDELDRIKEMVLLCGCCQLVYDGCAVLTHVHRR
jgi:Skp family chaperone for outer membrane proteins